VNKEIALEKNAILFVDDENICHTLVNLVIPNFTKYKVINAHNAEEAISLGKKYANSICLVLSDIMLPDISGYGIYKIFRKDKKLANIPFVFQSGIPCQEKELKKHLADESVQIIYKPYTQSDLVEMISKVLG